MRTLLLLVTKALSCLALFFPLSSLHAEQHCAASYQVKVSTQTEFEFKQKSVTRHKLTGYLSIKPLNNNLVNLPSAYAKSADVDAQWWALQLSEVVQTGNGSTMAKDIIYSLPFAALRASDGKLLDFKFPVEISAQDQDKLKGLAFYLQFAQAVPVSGTKLTRNEVDTIGKMQVSYQQPETAKLSKLKMTNTQFAEFEKNKIAYLNVENVKADAGAEQALQQITVLNSSQLINLNQCWFHSTSGNEQLAITAQGGSYNMTTNQRFKLIKLPNLAANSLLWQLPDDFNLWRLGQSQAPKLTKQQLQQLKQKLIAELAQLDLLSLRGSELGEWLKQFEPVIAHLGEMLKQSVFSDQQQMRIFNALGQMDSPNGNDLLVSLISDEQLDETNRFRAMRAITTGTKPLTAALTDKLTEMLTNDDFPGSQALKGAAIMALGAVINRRQSNEHSQRLYDEIANKLSSSTDSHEQAAIVASLGNTGQEQAVDTIENYAHNESAQVRANVAASLGQIGSEKAQQLLTGMLHHEADPKAQQAVIGAIGQFSLSVNDIERVSALASSSDSERTRGNAIKALAQQKQQPELAAKQLKVLMKSEKSRRNFVLAAKSLTALQHQGQKEQGGQEEQEESSENQK